MEGDIASHLFHQLLGDHQTQARSAVPTGNARIGLAERLEQTRLIALRNADAGIPDLNFNLDFIITERPFFDQNVDVAALGELNRVAHQIGDDLLQAQRVANDVIRYVIFDIERQFQPLIMRGVGEKRDHVIQCAAQREGDTLQNQLARFQLREVQYVVNNGQQVVG